MPSRHKVSANEMIQANPDTVAVVKTLEMKKGFIDSAHHHEWHQVIFPVRGLIQTQAGNYQYLIPHTSAIFVPSFCKHESIALTNTIFIGIYINPSLGRKYEGRVQTISITPFIRELILEIRTCSELDKYGDNLLRLLDVLYDKIFQEEVFTYQLLLPKDRRLRMIFNKLSDQPSLDWSLKIWGEQVGASVRTLSRLFSQEFNTTFPIWRQRLRLIYSLSLLDDDMQIQDIASEIGYVNDSSYIKAFSNNFGSTPQQFREQGKKQFFALRNK